ncbi:MAG: phosphoenolpyruvate carboxykinase (GTP), partial [Gammaproteobacteria bacterium]|nr:phosphoenolpyruvate carboxykinase (GTP) [Gammaproteobacteria bacterium]
GPAAHPNSRFTVSARQNPSYAEEADDPHGVPISAIIFGGRRASVAPLVYQSKDWTHGVLIGAGVASETTAAATGQVGVVRRDPMAMKPFCGYNFGDYWSHWLQMGGKSNKLPGIFHVNWFRQDENGKFIWPGFGENLRVLRWILGRCESDTKALETPIGYLPTQDALDTKDLSLNGNALSELLAFDKEQWKKEINAIDEYLESFGGKLPRQLKEKASAVRAALDAA